MLDFIVLFLSVGIPLSSALLLASLGETVNQRSGVFNLGCEGVMSMGAFVGMLIPFMVGGSGKVAWYVNVAGLAAAAVIGALFGLLFGIVVIKFGAPQGIAGIGLRLFGTGLRSGGTPGAVLREGRADAFLCHAGRCCGGCPDP